MHVLKPQAGAIDDGGEAVDLGQDPADIVLLSDADTEIAGLAEAAGGLQRAEPPFPSLRLASPRRLSHPLSVDLHVERTLSRARLIVLRLIGGADYWRYGVDETVRLARGHGVRLAVLSGTQDFDPALAALSTVPEEACRTLFAYLREGGAENYRRALLFMAHLLGEAARPPPPEPLPKAGFLPHARPDGRPVAALVFYRALVQSCDLAPVDALAAALAAEGLSPLPIFVSSLKDPEAAAFVEAALAAAQPAIVLNATAFALSGDGTPLDRAGVPVLQIAFAGTDEAAWRASPRGLSPRDLAMHVALPEIDGRIFVRAVSFKDEKRFDPATQTPIVAHRPRADRVAFAARLAAAWARLGRTPRRERRIALVLSNAFASDGRIGHAVGLDAPQSAVDLMRALAEAGYHVAGAPESGDALVARLLQGPTAEGVQGRRIVATVSGSIYRKFVDSLNNTLRESLEMFWGPEVRDSFFLDDHDAFAIPALTFGNVAVLVQPSRGGADLKAAQHDPALPPPHNYVAAYLWLRKIFRADAVVHFGKHGSLEWLPGKALALSAECWPEALLGALPLVYPFIVNDPGEGSQAKRRGAAVIVDHLIPPLRQAEPYGALADLEALGDEYAQAAGLDPRRAALVADRILEAARRLGLDRELGLSDDREEALGQLDAFLCDLRDLPIRDGLHVFGRAPEGEALAHLIRALGGPSDAEHPAGRRLAELVALSARQERAGVLRALDGGFVPPGPSGAPTRGRLDVLPTGRNFHSVDTRAVPTEAAWDLGRRAAEETVAAHVQEHGRHPRRIALSAWGTSAMRTGGDDIAQALAFMGVRPVWEGGSKRVTGFEVLALSELKRPRIDVVLRVSGFFRDAFPMQIDLIASAARAVAGRDEPAEVNPLSEEPELARIFSSAPGAYGTGLKGVLESGAWETRADLGHAFAAASGFAYGLGREGAPAAEALNRLLGGTEAVLQVQDAREFDLLDSADFFEFEGGLAAAVEAASGSRPPVYHADTARPGRVRVRRLAEEIALVVRGRAANPRWIAGVKRHGYRGAGEMAQTVASLFAFAATTGLVPPGSFEALHAAYLEDEDTRAFLKEKNPAALRDIARSFAEAVDRGFWRPRRNSLRAELDALQGKAPA